jgi:signal transduction histidine kinase
MTTLNDNHKKSNSDKLEHNQIDNEKISSELNILSNSFYKNAFDLVEDCIVILKINGEIIEINNVAVERYQIDITNLSSYNFYEIISKDEKIIFNAQLEQIKESEYKVFNSQYIDKNSESFFTENKIKYILVNNQEILFYVSKVVNIKMENEEDQKILNLQLQKLVKERTSQLEEALQELRNEIDEKVQTEKELVEVRNDLLRSLELEREYSELKSRFVSMISHEYRTPLTVILSATYILEYFFNNQDRDKFKESIHKIQVSVQSMTRLLEDVMKIGKNDGPITQLKLNKFDLIFTIDKIINEIKFVEKINHIYEIKSNYASLIVYLDEKLINEIIRNIIHNSSKYSEKDTNIVVNVNIINNLLYIIISDEGIGIPEDDLKNLFEPFFRSGNVGAVEGTGLGLHLSKKYVEALRGEMFIESKQNKGTKTTLVFPVNNYEINLKK